MKGSVIETIVFDADDTLWHNESLFSRSHDRFRELLIAYHDGTWIDQKLYETEVRNLSLFGYGIKGFMLSMIETAIELTEGRVTGAEIQGVIELGKEMLQAPVDPLPGVRETLAFLAQSYPLMVITKGDLFDQETKIARSGLGDFFKRVEVVSEKNSDVYAEVFQRHQLKPEHTMMVGNSLKSDILPVLALGAHGVHIPYHTTWVHEQVADHLLDGKVFSQLDTMSELPALLERIHSGV